MSARPPETRREIRRYLLVGTVATVLLAGGVGAWAVTTDIAGAIYAPGLLVVDSSLKKVQHPTGGVVAELRVRDGDRVKTGDLIVRLDETITRANLAVIDKALVENAARQARDEAERDGRAAVRFPADLLARAAADPEIAGVVAGEEALFALRLNARNGQKAQLKERIGQLKEEIRGLDEQVKAKALEIELIGKELAGVRTLWEKNMVPIMRLTALERDAAKIGGERGSLIAQIAQARGKMTETELQILQIDQEVRAEASRDLSDIRGKTAELVERRIAAEDQLKRTDIRATEDGIVHQLAVHTVGGVVPVGEPLMLIVPESDALTVEAKVSPQDIDQLWLGQKAVLRFSAFSQRTTPELKGEVTRVSADVTQDPKSGANYYTIRVSLSAAEIVRLGGVKLVPGMPVESFIQTGERSVASYLTKPLYDQLAKAWREN